MPHVTIDPNECTKDHFCVAACPVGLLLAQPGEIPQERPQTAEYCIRCGHCEAVCPSGAIALPDEGAMLPEPIVDGLAISPEAVAQFLKTRRSIRAYKDKEVDRKTLENVLEVTRLAPTGANSQNVRWTVLQGKGRLQELCKEVVEGLRPIPYFSLLVTAWEGGKDAILRGAPHVFAAHAPTSGLDPTVDCTIALTYLELAAHGYGLGTCWAGVVMAGAMNNPKVVGLLDLPEGHKMCGAMMLGYPESKHIRIPRRNAVKVRWM